jgi:hypothetical protein
MTRPGPGEHLLLPRGYERANAPAVLPWESARRKLEAAGSYWLATVRADGRPHVTPLWGAWVNDDFYFTGIPTAQWARNIVPHPEAAVHLESGADVVIVEGMVVDLPTIADRGIADAIVAQWTAKYGRLVPDPVNDGMYCLRPTAARAWSRFPDDATRWRFA